MMLASEPSTRRAPLTVRGQLMVLVLAIASLVGGLFAWMLVEVSHETRRSAAADVRMLAVRAAASLAVIVQEHDEHLEQLQERPLVRALDPQRCDPALDEYAASQQELAEVAVIHARGHLVCTVAAGPATASLAFDAGWVRAGLTHRDFLIGSAWADGPTQRWVVPFTKPVLDMNGAIIGLMVAAVDLLKLQRLLFDAVPEGAVVTVLDAEGRILMRSADAVGRIGTSVSKEFNDAANRAADGNLVAPGSDGLPWLYAPVRMASTEWVVVAGLPEQVALASRSELLRRGSIAIGAGLLLMIVVGWRIANRLMQPVRALAAASARVSRGDVSARAVPAGPSEIRDLALRFNEMLDARQRHDETLRISEERLQRALDASELSLWDYDVASGAVYLSDGWSLLMAGPRIATRTTIEALMARVPADEQPRLQAALRVALKDPGALYRVEHRVRRDDGSLFWTQSEGRVVERDARGHALRVIGTNRDITERKRGETLLDGQKQVLEMIVASAPLRSVLAALTRMVEAQAPGMMCSVLLLDADGVHLRHGAAPSLPESFSRAVDGITIGEGIGSCGTAAFRREAVIVDDIATSPLWADYREFALGYGLRACWSVPILDTARHVLGTFAMYYREPARPSARQLWLIDVAIQSAAIAIDHARAQAALRRSMEVLENTFENMDQGISISDAELRVVGVNRRFRELLDLPPSLCLPGTPAAAIFRHNADRGDYGPGDVDALVHERMELARRFEPHHFERERPNGTILEIRGQPLPGGGFVSTYTDVTERARSERQLKRFRAALNLSADSIYLIDARTLTVLDCNEGACRALGYEGGELIGSELTRIVADRGADELRAQLERAAAGDAAQIRVEALHRRKDGSVFPVEVSRRVDHTADGPIAVAVARDVTQRKQAEDALRESEEKLRAVVDNALDAVLRMDEGGCVVGWNAQAERCFGWSAAEALGRPLADLIVPQRYRDAHVRGLGRFLATGDGPALNRRIEMVAVHRDGHEIPVELAVAPIRVRGGYEFSGFVRDLTSAKQAEAAHEVLETKMREAQKMEAIGTLAGGIAHDFNNILGAILGNVALARDEVGEGHRSQGSLSQVHRAAQRARALVKQILTFSRRQPQQLVVRPLRPLVEETLAMLRATLPAGVALEAQLADDTLHALCDATQLQQVLMNLCTNAWHALPDGRDGHVVVGLQAAAGSGGDASPEHGAAPGGYAHLWVRDDGCGMDDATRARIFEPFYTTKPVGHGTGLGLAVVHGIVSAHHGAIRVESIPGRGSTFHVYLPLAEAADAEAPSVWDTLPPAQGLGQHVLYVDDEEVMTILAERLLARAGYRVTSCRDPAAALAAVGATGGDFEAVVTDYDMPRMSGIELAREISRVRPGLPVVISSGLITDEMRCAAPDAGVRFLMQKENTFAELVPLVQRVLAEGADGASHPTPGAVAAVD